MELVLLSPSDAVWQTADSAKPRNAWDSPSPGTVLVQFEAVAPADGRLKLVVLAMPGSATRPAAGELKLTALADWK
jgi:hypothetical protein